MRLLLLFLFLAYPMLEIALMIKVGRAIGIFPLLGIILATAIIGALTLRHKGVTLLRRVSESMAEGRPPIQPAFDGALLGIAGLLLIAPGLITDGLGLILLIPFVRHFIIKHVWHRFTVMESTHAGESAATREPDEDQIRDPFRRERRPPRGPLVIEGEYERIDEKPIDPKNSSNPSPGDDKL